MLDDHGHTYLSSRYKPSNGLMEHFLQHPACWRNIESQSHHTAPLHKRTVCLYCFACTVPKWPTLALAKETNPNDAGLIAEATQVGILCHLFGRQQHIQATVHAARDAPAMHSPALFIDITQSMPGPKVLCIQLSTMLRCSLVNKSIQLMLIQRHKFCCHRDLNSHAFLPEQLTHACVDPEYVGTNDTKTYHPH
jgi:hypothetical protein